MSKTFDNRENFLTNGLAESSDGSIREEFCVGYSFRIIKLLMKKNL